MNSREAGGVDSGADSGATMDAALGIERVLQQEGRAIGEFIQLLAREQRALAEHRLDSINDFASEKAARLAVLAGFAGKRAEQMRTAGHGADADGLRAWLAAFAAVPGVAREWARVTDLARRARELNEDNGRLIASGLQRTQRLLAFLNKAASNEPVYAADGLARSSVLRRSLGEA